MGMKKAIENAIEVDFFDLFPISDEKENVLREFRVNDRVVSTKGDHGTVEHVAKENDLWSAAPYAVRHDSDGRIYWHTEKGLKHE